MLSDDYNVFCDHEMPVILVCTLNIEIKLVQEIDRSLQWRIQGVQQASPPPPPNWIKYVYLVKFVIKTL